MLFISHRTADKPAALEVKRRALERGNKDGQLFLDSDPSLASSLPLRKNAVRNGPALPNGNVTFLSW